jgi:hypothetical protein
MVSLFVGQLCNYYKFGEAECPVGFSVPTEGELKADTTDSGVTIEIVDLFLPIDLAI